MTKDGRITVYQKTYEHAKNFLAYETKSDLLGKVWHVYVYKNKNPTKKQSVSGVYVNHHDIRRKSKLVSKSLVSIWGYGSSNMMTPTPEKKSKSTKE